MTYKKNDTTLNKVTLLKQRIMEKNLIDKLSCFVIMPYGSKNEYEKGILESDFVYNDIICPAIDLFKNKFKIEVDITREVDKNVAGSINKSIVEHIAKADFCIVDITGQNANVFFELGIRYALRDKVTILLRQEGNEIPFDITNYRCITYQCFKRRNSINEIADYLESGYSKNISDSLVYEVFPDIELMIPKITKSRQILEKSQISWVEWWEQINFYIKKLKVPYDGGHLSPDFILGLSNGGAIIAELLGKGLLFQKPILMFWLDRWSELEPSKYCDNKINNGIINGIKERFNQKEKLTIFITDDIVNSGASFYGTHTYLTKSLSDFKCKILFIPLFAKNESYLKKLEDFLIIGDDYSKYFNIDKETYFKKILTDKQTFPYDKPI
jgi:hypoxanthine phosphoribosyltransferase